MIRRAKGVETRFRKRLRAASHSPVSLCSPPFADDLGVNPRLMTERQQLAFLLRKTAQDASSSSGADEEEEEESSSSSESSGEDEARPRALRRLRRAAEQPPSRTTRSRSVPSAGDEPVVIYCGRGRPPKNAIMPNRRGVDKENRWAAKHEPVADSWRADCRLRSASASIVKNEVDTVKTEQSNANISVDASRSIKAERPDAKLSADVSPSSSATACALCCSDARIVVDATVPLFLCATCDRKYPTQQALGRRTCAA